MITTALAMLNAGQNRIYFPKLGFTVTVRSTAFSLFGAPVTWYGVLITIGMMLAMIYAFRRMRSYGIDSDRAIDGVIGGVIGAIIGARAYYILFHWSEYAGDWGAIFNIRKGGLAIYGGIIGALLVGSVVCKLRKVRLLPMYDLTALGLLIGQGIGRWGNFTNHEAFGCNTDGLFGMTSGRIQNWITQNIHDGSVVADKPVHPCFFYESMWCLLGFVILHIVAEKWRKFDGQIFLMYMVWYGAGRFFIESLRTDSLFLGTIKISQAVALLSVVTGIVLLAIGVSYVRRQGDDYVLYCDTAESKALLAESDEREAAWQEVRKQRKYDKAPSYTKLPYSLKTAAVEEDDDDDDDDWDDELDDELEDEPVKKPVEEPAEEPEEEPEEEPDEEPEEAPAPAKPAKSKDEKIDALLAELAAKKKTKDETSGKEEK